MSGAQLVPCAAGKHVPAPSQVRAGINVAPTHVAGAQTIPLDSRMQAPWPSHAPVVPHVATSREGQTPRGSG
jgi:hypothetical protein